MTAQPALRLPRDLDQAAFLSRYWQKRPLFLPAALPHFAPPLSIDEIAGLACEPEVESRLVFTERRSDGVRYRAETGPFAPDTLAALPRSDWTLLVHDLDRHLPELRPLLLAPRFLPLWRMGDLMVSVAAPGGSVGPHQDSYDVFLLQGEGRRSWQLGSGEPTSRHPGLRLLDEFRSEQEIHCSPGDALYVPPGVGHHGVAETLCTTWSLGLQAPLMRDLAVFLDRDGRHIPPDRRYSDRDLTAEECQGGIIHPAAIQRCRNALPGRTDRDDPDIAEALGRLVTMPKPDHRPATPGAADAAARVDAALAGRTLRIAPSACFRAADETDDAGWLFAGGESFPLPAGTWPLACRLAGAEGAAGIVVGEPERERAESLLSVLARYGLLEILPARDG